MPEAAQNFLATLHAEVEIVQGPHLETVVPVTVQHLRADVLTLDGKKV